MATRPVDEWETINTPAADEWETVSGPQIPPNIGALHEANKEASQPTFGQALWQGTKGVAKGVYHAAQGIGEMAQGITQPESIITGEMQRQQELSKRPQDLSTTLERIPLLGPMAAGLGQDVGKAIYGTPEEAGEVIGRQGAPLIAGVKGAKAARAASESAIPESANLVARLLKETGAASEKDLGALQPKLHSAIVDIHDEALNHSNLPFNKAKVSTLHDLANSAANRIWKENMHPALKQAGWKQHQDMSPVIAKISEGIDPTIAENASLVKQLSKKQAEYTTQPWSYNRIEKRIQTLNDMTKSMDFKAKAGLPRQGMILRELQALRDIEAEGLGQATGMDVKGFKSRYGALAETRDYLRDAADVTKGRGMIEPPPSFARGVGKALSTVDVRHPLSPAPVGKIAKSLVNVQEPSLDQLAGQALKRMGGFSKRTAQATTPTAPPSALTAKTPEPLVNRPIPYQPRNPAEPAASSPSVRNFIDSALSGETHEDIGSIRNAARKKPPLGGSERGSWSNKPVNPEGPYANKPGPVEPDMSMENFLNLHNVSPEAQRFLGYNKPPANVSIPPPPTKGPPIVGSEPLPGAKYLGPMTGLKGEHMGDMYDIIINKEGHRSSGLVPPGEDLAAKIKEVQDRFKYIP